MSGKSGWQKVWIVHVVVLPAWRKCAIQARAVPAAVWQRWVLALVLGYVAAAGVAGVATVLARRWIDHGLQAWDERLLQGLADSAFTYPHGLWFEAWGSSAFLVPMLLVAILLLARGGRLYAALTLVIAYVANKGLVLGTWQLWDRARPELIGEGIASPGLHSFPSGHAVNAIVLFGLLGAMWWRASRSPVEKALAVLAVTAVVLVTCLGRLRLGTHWPSDIVAGLLIGAVWLAGLIVALAVAEHGSAVRHESGAGAGGADPAGTSGSARCPPRSK